MERPWCRAQLCLGLLHTVLLRLAVGTQQESAVSFEMFTKKYGPIYDGGLAEFEERHALFQARAAKVVEQNRQPHRRWTAAINVFSDRTSTELSHLRGWRRRGSPAELPHHSLGVESLSLRQKGRAMPRPPLPKTVSWAFLNATKRHYNQGSCGSCWAIASAVLLEAHSEIHSPEGKSRTFSAQELVSCVPNPRHCGGTGGCEGATIELAMEWTIKHGLSDDIAAPYTASDEECKAHAEGASLLQIHERPGVQSVVPLEEAAGDSPEMASSSPGAQFGMMSWERLPENKYEDLLLALQDGPVGISVAASDWFEYSHGIFDKCVKDAVIDHAVILIGYGQDTTGDGYWLIKNSWGPEWGEHSQMRLLRRGERDGEEDEGSWCGVDHQPELGSGCDQGPPEVTVCGTCGILYDTVVPHWRGEAEKAKQQARSPEKY